MVKIPCSICCKDKSTNNLHTICSNCISESMQICANCLSKMIECEGVPINSRVIYFYIRCPFCRTSIRQDQIENSSFGRSYNYFKAMYEKHKVLVEILSIDKNDLWDIRQSILLPAREILRSHRAYNSWLQSRLGRPIELNAEIQEDYSR